MCNIVTERCRGCDRRMETHIGDFSVHEDYVTVFCPKCQKKALKYILGTNYGGGQIIFIDHGCMFISDLPRSISLNGTPRQALGKIPRKKSKEFTDRKKLKIL